MRLPNDILYKLLRNELNENVCRNRGYILCGFPRTFKDAQNVFLIRPKKFDDEGNEIEEDEPELEEGEEKSFEGYIRDEAIFPQHTILLDADDSFLIDRAKNLDQS